LTNPQKSKFEVEARSYRNSESNTGLGVPTVADPRPTSGNFTAGKEEFIRDGDRSLFHVTSSEETTSAALPRRSLSLEQSQQLPTLDFEEPSFYIAWKAKQKEIHGEDWTPVPANWAPPVPPEPEPDYLAEFLEWLATTDSIVVVE
jgi:hypothetical protein